MPRICFVGDIHGEIASMYRQLDVWQQRIGTIDAIVQVGDFGVYTTTTFGALWYGAKPPIPIPTWVAMGNHEDPALIARWQEEPDRIPNLHLMADGEISDVLGVKIGVVWGNYSPISWLHPERVHKNRQSADWPRIAMHIDHDAVDRLLAGGEMDVLVTHDSASATLPTEFRTKEMPDWLRALLGLQHNEAVAGCPAFNDVLRKHKPKHYFFGHLHVHDHGIVGSTHYTCLNAINYPGGPWLEVVKFPDYGEVTHETSVSSGELVAA